MCQKGTTLINIIVIMMLQLLQQFSNNITKELSHPFSNITLISKTEVLMK